MRNKGIINPDAKYIRDGMFDWSDEEENEFYFVWAKDCYHFGGQTNLEEKELIKILKNIDYE